jgi:ABC-2 type transport system ATP-binding protein
MNASDLIVETKQLTKNYGKLHALAPIDLQIPGGSALALLGRNGSGKSTLIRLLMGFIRPSSGSAKVLGVNPLSCPENIRARIAYVADSQDLPNAMTPAHYLAYLRPFYPTWDHGFEKRLIKLFDVPLDRKISHLSRGQRVKAAFVGALSFHPSLLLLDEPFSGLDPAVRDEVLDALFETMNTQEWTMVISSHEIEEVEKLADNVIMMDAGLVRLREEKDTLLARCRSISLHTPATLTAAALPAHWWNPVQLDDRITFVDSDYEPEKFHADLHRHFPEHRHLTIDPAPLRSITRALLRHND